MTSISLSRSDAEYLIRKLKEASESLEGGYQARTLVQINNARARLNSILNHLPVSLEQTLYKETADPEQRSGTPGPNIQVAGFIGGYSWKCFSCGHVEGDTGLTSFRTSDAARTASEGHQCP